MLFPSNLCASTVRVDSPPVMFAKRTFWPNSIVGKPWGSKDNNALSAVSVLPTCELLSTCLHYTCWMEWILLKRLCLEMRAFLLSFLGKMYLKLQTFCRSMITMNLIIFIHLPHLFGCSDTFPKHSPSLHTFYQYPQYFKSKHINLSPPTPWGAPFGRKNVRHWLCDTPFEWWTLLGCDDSLWIQVAARNALRVPFGGVKYLL